MSMSRCRVNTRLVSLCAVTPAEIQTTLNLVHRIYAAHGYKFSLPQNTNPTKTYQWRYATLLTKYFKYWQLDAGMQHRYVEVAISYMATNGLVAKGLSVICQDNIHNLVMDHLQSELDHNADAIADIERTHTWLANNVAAGNPHNTSTGIGSTGSTRVASLLQRRVPLAFCNIVKWYMEQHISDLYITLSRSMRKALNSLDSSERAMLPSDINLYVLRARFTAFTTNVTSAQRILGEDYNQCQL